MATNTRNNTHNNTNHVNWMPLPASQCIPWLTVYITEWLAIVILNIITIIVFVKQRQQQRRRTYLIIHLAIVDLLIGAVSGPLWNEHFMGNFCELWDYNRDVNIWVDLAVKGTVRGLPVSSLINLAVISLERVHATFCPFRHRFLKNWVYGVIIAVIWIMYVGFLVVVAETRIRGYRINVFILQFTLFLFCLFVICVSYISIIVKVRCHRHHQHHGAAGMRERKLTSTLFLVTFASLLTWLPFVIYQSLVIFHITVLTKLSLQSYAHIFMALQVLYFSNSLINPIIYALRMPELRAGVSQLLRRNSNRQPNPVDVPLQNP